MHIYLHKLYVSWGLFVLTIQTLLWENRLSNMSFKLIISQKPNQLIRRNDNTKHRWLTTVYFRWFLKHLTLCQISEQPVCRSLRAPCTIIISCFFCCFLRVTPFYFYFLLFGRNADEIEKTAPLSVSVEILTSKKSFDFEDIETASPNWHQRVLVYYPLSFEINNSAGPYDSKNRMRLPVRLYFPLSKSYKCGPMPTFCWSHRSV